MNSVLRTTLLAIVGVRGAFHTFNSTHFLEGTFVHVDGSACCSTFVNTSAANSVSECENRCRSGQTVCDSFVFQPSNGNCWIGKSSSGGLVTAPSPDRIAGIAPWASMSRFIGNARLDIPRILNLTVPYGTGVVLGVGRGQFTKSLLSNWAGGLYLVDPYIHIWRGYDDPSNVDDETHQLIFENLRRDLVPFEHRHVFVRDFSESVAELWRNKSLPSPVFVYVDNNHAEAAVRRDLELWWELLTPGGVIAGSMYHSLQVKRAVDMFIEHVNTNVYLVGNQFQSEWIVFKPL
jgi:hypothetical protein